MPTQARFCNHLYILHLYLRIIEQLFIERKRKKLSLMTGMVLVYVIGNVVKLPSTRITISGLLD